MSYIKFKLDNLNKSLVVVNTDSILKNKKIVCGYVRCSTDTKR